MEERRQHSRHSIELQLEVFDLHTGQRLGRVADFSADGFMLFSDKPHQADTLVECRLVSEQVIDGVCEVKLNADCLWSRPGADGQHCWAGFHIVDLEQDQAAALDVLLKHL
ncbi:PilZ domain-containing protein [Pseudomonas sp. sp1636]|uniref:PilZ domain-containing protein n=1 Tax=Pseudomonas sp. sp1636 TaxID=3036707 RepID=UPI0025A4D4A7|nr:PilZ domain-containing protein [Pseudomonas sp. sp1636]MDM8347595.1 PilZ domain-containing protein [Pseudomonas sp. sp1636]